MGKRTCLLLAVCDVWLWMQQQQLSRKGTTLEASKTILGNLGHRLSRPYPGTFSISAAALLLLWLHVKWLGAQISL